MLQPKVAFEESMCQLSGCPAIVIIVVIVVIKERWVLTTEFATVPNLGPLGYLGSLTS